MTNKKQIRMRNRRKESAFTLLEYCAGAAVLMVLIWGAINAMGGNVADLLDSIGNWASSRSAEIGKAQAVQEYTGEAK